MNKSGAVAVIDSLGKAFAGALRSAMRTDIAAQNHETAAWAKRRRRGVAS